MMSFYFSLFHFFFFIFCAPISFSFSSVQSLSCVQLFVTPWTPGLPVYHQLPEFTQTHVHWVSHAIQPSHPLSSPFPPAFNLSQHQGLFKWVSSLHQVAKVLEFQLQHQSFQWIFRTDFLQDGLIGCPCSPRNSQSLLQHHSSKASILWCSAFFIVQLSHPYMITGKTIGLARRTFVGKVMSLLFNMLSRLVITFLPFSYVSSFSLCFPISPSLLFSFFFLMFFLKPLSSIVKKLLYTYI